jgi:hypothetical protein
MYALRAIVAAALLLPGALAVAVPAVEYCQNPRVVNTTYVGQDKNVKVEHLACDAVAAPVAAHAIEARQSNNVCGAPCKSLLCCISPAC